MPNFPTLQGTVKELCNYKVLKMGQNLHANVEGFCRAGHNLLWYNMYSYCAIFMLYVAIVYICM